MGSGERFRRRRTRVRRRRRFGFRSRRRVGPGRRRYYRRGRGGGDLFVAIGKLCGLCIGAISASISETQKNVNTLKEDQDEILKKKAERKEQNQEDADADAEEAENIKEIQEAQTELLNDILERIAKEKDPDRLQQLFEQQNLLISQMNQLQTAGFKYDNEIPAPKETQQSENQQPQNSQPQNPQPQNPQPQNPQPQITQAEVPQAATY